MFRNKKSINVLILSMIFCAKLVSQNNIKIIITSYNNANWYKKNLDSVFEQTYTNYQIIYIDDASQDNTASLVENYVKEKHQENKVLLIRNQINLSQMANHYYAVHMCDDNDIVVHLDGDDWFASPEVLSTINQVYSTTDTWVTYGRALEWPQNSLWPLTETTYNDLHRRITNNSFREEEWVYGHLRTFRAWLFKKIKLQDLIYEGTFEKMSPAPDVAFMYPMLEMAGNHITFLTPVMYIWNKSNPISQYRLGITKVQKLHYDIINWRKYKPLKSINSPKFDNYNKRLDLFILPNEVKDLSRLFLLDNLEQINNVKIFIPYFWNIQSNSKNISLLKYNQENSLKELLITELKNCDEYICILTDVNKLNNLFDFSVAIDHLEKTNAKIYSFDYNQEFLQKNKIPYVKLFNETLAFQEIYNTNNLTMAIYRKKSLLKTLNQINFENALEFCQKTNNKKNKPRKIILSSN